MPSVIALITPKPRDIGSFSVRRALPAIEQRAVGPFVFFDHMGPAIFAPGEGIDVRPHPHIGLATVTYLFDGEIMHRDSLGSLQPIRPGDVNWMTAGRGIAHSERTAPELRTKSHKLHGIQLWVGLPQAHEEAAPAFHHHAASALPRFDIGKARLRLILGDAYGQRSPVAVHSPMVYLDVALPAGERLVVPAEHRERALYVAEGAIAIDGNAIETGHMAVLAEGRDVALIASGDVRLVILGGEPLDGPRHLWWNFVSSSKERIEQAKRDWAEGRFKPVPGETEFIPLPPH